MLISVTPSQGHQSGIHKVLGTRCFPFIFMERSEVPAETRGRGPASSQSVGLGPGQRRGARITLSALRFHSYDLLHGDEIATPLREDRDDWGRWWGRGGVEEGLKVE